MHDIPETFTGPDSTNSTGDPYSAGAAYWSLIGWLDKAPIRYYTLQQFAAVRSFLGSRASHIRPFQNTGLSLAYSAATGM